MNDQERLRELQDKLTTIAGEADAARAQVSKARAVLEGELTQALIDNRPVAAADKLNKALAAAEQQLRQDEERSALLTKAIVKLQAKIEFDHDERITASIQDLQKTIRPLLARVNALTDELAVASHELLKAVYSHEAWGHIGPQFLGMFLYPARDPHDPNQDCSERALRARVLGDLANLGAKVAESPKRLQKVG